MPAFHRSFNPYSSAPPPPVSPPDYVIPPATVEPLTNEQAGALIDAFLETQGGKVLTLSRLADYLLGRTQIQDNGDIKELEDILEEERRREAGTVQVLIDDTSFNEVKVEQSEDNGRVPAIKMDKKQARKEERRLKKDKKREKQKHGDDRQPQKINDSQEDVSPKKEKRRK